MKRLTLLTIIMISLTFGQNIKVLETKVLVEKNGNTEFAFPKFSPQGDKVLYTSVGYQGLWIFDLNTSAIKQLNDKKGAGYEPTFSTDGNEVFFRHDKLIKKRKYFSIAHQSVNSLEMQDLIKDERDISTPRVIAEKVFVYKKDDMPVAISFEQNNGVCLLEKTTTEAISAFTENSNLYLEKDGEKSILNPVGEGHYIWGSISPNHDKVLFTLAGNGTFITDLKGNVELKLLNANFPCWSPDGNWIVYMADKDDGHVVTSSDIKAAHVATQKNFALTSSTDKLEMYPIWSPKGNEILYHTMSGNIEMLTVEIQE